MKSVLRIGGQLIAYAAFAAAIAFFSVAPAYGPGADTATIKLSISHATQRRHPCVQLTVEEIAALPPNRRRPAECSRERLPLLVVMQLDGRNLAELAAEPAGLWNDGAASVYRTFRVQPGRRRLTLGLRDSDRSQGWDAYAEHDVELRRGRYLTIAYDATAGEFVVR